MRLVDHQPVRPCGLDPQTKKGGHQLGKKARAFGNIDPEKIENDVLLGVAEKLDDFGHAGCVLGVAQYDSVWEIGMVALRVDNAELKIALHDLLDQARRDRRLAAP